MTTDDYRPFLRNLFDAAVASAQPTKCVSPYLPDPPKGRTIVVGAGKAAAAMAQAVERSFRVPVSGVVVTRYGSVLPCEHLRVLEAAHPIADQNSLLAARKILEVVENLTPDDLVIALISGGGSALLTLPVTGVTLQDKQTVVHELMKAGAPVTLLNRVRSALSAIKGGKLLDSIYPARCVSLLISDVVGDDPSLIASGPTIPSDEPQGDLLRELELYGFDIPASVRVHLSSRTQPNNGPRSHPRSRHCLIATPQMALEAAAAKARDEGWNTIILSDAEEGSPHESAARHLEALRQAPQHSVILSGGELTCTLRGPGKGGPNLEFSLELARQAGSADVLWALAGDTDGVDGNSGVAGAIVAPDTLARAAAAQLSPEEYLANSNSYRFFEVLDDLVDPGPTQTNVNDFRAILKP